MSSGVLTAAEQIISEIVSQTEDDAVRIFDRLHMTGDREAWANARRIQYLERKIREMCKSQEYPLDLGDA